MHWFLLEIKYTRHSTTFILRKKRYFLILKCKIDFQAMHPKKLTISLERESHNDIFIYFHYKCNLLHIRSLPKREEEIKMYYLDHRVSIHYESLEIPTHFCFHKCSKITLILSPSLFSFHLISFSYVSLPSWLLTFNMHINNIKHINMSVCAFLILYFSSLADYG